MALLHQMRTVSKFIFSSLLSNSAMTSSQKNYLGSCHYPLNHIAWDFRVSKKFVMVDFVTPYRNVEVYGHKGDSIWKIAVKEGIMKRNPSCDGVLKCSDCHGIIKKEDYDKLPEMRSDEKLHLEKIVNSTPTVRVVFVGPDGSKNEAHVQKGESIWKIALKRGIVKSNASCDGTLKCSDCHAIFKKEDYDKLPEPRSDEQLMLQRMSDSTDTSRLCCQVRLYKYLDNIEVKLPPTRRP